MPTILYSPASPYSAKVRMAARYAGVSLLEERIDTNNNAGRLASLNPLGKIPVIVSDEGEAIFDSRVLTQYLNRLSGNALFPRSATKRLEAEKLEALADGICDCLLAHVYERRYRPEDKIHPEWLDKQWNKVTAALDYLNAAPPRLPKKITVGQIAVRVTLGYLDLRFEGKWERGRSRLTRWATRFDEKFPDLADCVPRS